MAARPQMIALIASLALNLFLVCGIAGAALSWAQAPRPAAAKLPLRFAADGLSPEHRAAFRATLRAVNHDAAPLVQQARDSRRRAAALFVQPTFDARAISQTLDQARQADVAVRTRLESAVVNFAAGLSVQERMSLADGLRRGGPLRQPPAAKLKPAPGSR